MNLRGCLGSMVLLAISLIAVSATMTAHAAEVEANAEADAEFTAFLRTWRSAAERNDAAALAAMAQVPFLFEGREHDRDGIARTVVPALFTPAVRRCLRSVAPLNEDGRHVLSCAPYLFYLERIDGRWRWVEFAADGEG